MPAAVTRPAPVLDPAALRRRLAALRRRLRFVATFRGASWLLAAVVATVAVACLLDWRFQLPSLVRAVLLVFTLAGGGYLFYRHLFRPLSARTDDLSLALRIEESYPSLNDALGSTVQFLEQSRPPADSASVPLQREAVKRTLGRATGLDFNRVVDSRGLRSAGLSVVVVCALGVALLVWRPTQAFTALSRLASPFGGREWPRLTQLEIDPPRLRIGRNEPFDVTGRLRGVVPEKAVVLFRFENAPPVEHLCDVARDAHGEGRFGAHLEPGRVQRNFRFQVRANDAVSPEYEVKVLPPPSLVPLDGQPSPQLRLDYPAYTDLPSPYNLQAGTGNVEAVLGTQVTLRAAADRPLRRAWIEYQPEARLTTVSAFLSPLGSRDVSSALSLSAGGRSVCAPVAAILEQDRSRFRVVFMPRVLGMYVLHIEDDTGLRNSRLFELRLQPDPAPVVRLERPSPTRDVLTVLPTAELALDVVVEDPQFAVRTAYLEYRTGRDEAPRTLPLYDPAGFVRRVVVPWAGVGVLAAGAPRLRPQHLDFRRPLALKDIRHPDGSRLKDGDVVILQACADDFDDVLVNKEPGRSHQVEIRVVGREELDLVLNQEQSRIQQDLVRLREKERDAVQKVTAAENKLKKGETLTPEELDQLLQAEQLQQQIRERVGDHKEGLRAEVERVLDTLKQNGMQSSGARERMKRVERELDRLAENELQQIEPRLTSARKQAELLEVKTRAERRTQLEANARQAEKEARGAEESADRKADEAAKAEERAAKSGSEREKARLLADAKQQRERAEELRQKARELRQQAERERREAAQAPDKDQPRQALADARRKQEEVEKTLNDLLGSMEPFVNSREIKGEIGRILQEQKQLAAQVEAMEQKDKELQGKRPDELTDRQRAELENVRDAQQRLQERTNQMLDKMKRVAQQRAEKDPENARELQDAANQAEKGNVTGQMQNAAEHIKQNQLKSAQENQKGSIKELQKLVKNLEDRREAELDRLVKKLREAEQKLDDLADEQERLKKKVEEANKIADPAQREEELKKLARRQKELEKQAQEMVQQLSRVRADRASQALSRAGGEMQEAGNQMQQGQGDDEKQDEALDRLEDALREVERAREQAEDELAREQLTRVADVLKRLRDRMEPLVAEAGRIQREAQQRKGWERGLKISLRGLADNQKGLADETAEVAKKDLGGAPVFARIVRRSGEAMEKASERLAAMVTQPPELDALPDEEAGRLQQEALRRLDQLLAAIKEATESPAPLGGGGGGSGGGGGGGGEGGGRQGDGIPPLAQLKLLRSMQKDVNDRTEAFRKAHPDPKKLDDKAKAALEAIQAEQKDVAELVEEMTRPADEPKGGEGEKK
jgi:hypothetical protein